MGGQKIKATVGEQPIHVALKEERIDVALAKETINIPAVDGGIQFSIKEERFDFSSRMVLATPGWPFGPNPNKVEGLVKNEATVVDEVVMPSFYRVARWLFLISDETNDLAVTSEIKCMRRGNDVFYMEYAIMGDSGLLPYELDAVVEGEKIKLIVISRHDGGEVTVRTSKMGIFQ